MNSASRLAAMRTKKTRECSHCGETFKGIVIARYCSGKCRSAAKRLRDKEKETK